MLDVAVPKVGLQRAGVMAIVGELEASGMAVCFKLPELKCAQDAVRAMGTITAAISAGTITVSEGAELGKTIESFVHVLEVGELEERIIALEANTNNAQTPHPAA